MGYDMHYELSIHQSPAEGTVEELADILFQNLEVRQALAVDYDGNSIAPTRDDIEDHMISLSLSYPDHVFRVRAEGGDPMDLADLYFKNGKYQHCQAIITMPEYDENELMSLKEV